MAEIATPKKSRKRQKKEGHEKNIMVKTVNMAPSAAEEFEDQFFKLTKTARKLGEKVPTKGDFLSKIIKAGAKIVAEDYFK
jgi:hypothetical protein